VTLALVEQDLGAEIARTVARKLVVYHRRAGGQSQFSALLDLEPKSDRIQRTLTYARRNLQTPLSVPQLAKAANLSRASSAAPSRPRPGNRLPRPSSVSASRRRG
jgi:transcriptional regulator GlxA family with amidase domain